MSNIDSIVTIPCIEPACEHYDKGHEVSRSMFEKDGYLIHQTPGEGIPALWVCVSKCDDEPWRVEYFEGRASNEPMSDADEATELAAIIVRAAQQCRDLNRI